MRSLQFTSVKVLTTIPGRGKSAPGTATKIDGRLEEEPAIKVNLVGTQEPKASSELPETKAVKEQTPHHRNRRAKSGKRKTSKGILPSIVANLVTKTGDAAYNALKEAGYVRYGAEFVDNHV